MDDIVKYGHSDSSLLNPDIFVRNWSKMSAVAVQMMKTGLLPPAYTKPEQVILAVMKGRELQLPPIAAVEGLFPVGTKIGMTAQLMAGLIRRSGELEFQKIERLDRSVRVTVKRKGDPFEHTEEFGDTDATLLGLITKDNYKKQKFTMFKWRALASAYRVVFPDLLQGLYLAEELNPDVKNNTDYPEEEDAVTIDIQKDPLMVYNGAMEALRKIEKSGTWEELQSWYELYKDEVSELPDNLKSTISRLYTQLKTKLEPKDAKNGTDRPVAEQPENKNDTNQTTTTTAT